MRLYSAAKAALSALPKGALQVGGGLLVLGATSYGFLLVAAHNLTPSAFAGLSVLYVLVYTVGPGMFLPFEQEVGRALADRRVRGQGAGPLLRRSIVLGSIVLAVLVVAVLVAEPILTKHLFDNSTLLFGGLLLSMLGLWGAHLSRGAFAGSGRFGAYGTELATEGSSRFVACVVLAVLGVHAPGAYGLLLGGAFILSVLVTVRRLPDISEPGPDARWEELTGAVGWLVVGSLLAQVLVNVGPVAVKLLATSAEKEAAGQLLAGLVLARLPLFLFAAVQAALLPRLAALVGRGDLSGFVSGIRRLLVTVLALAAVTTLVLAVAGPSVLRLLFGSKFHLGRLDLTLLSTATGLFMAANVLGNALLALQRFGLAVVGWGVGVVVLFAVIAFPDPLFGRVEHSFVLGTLAALLAFLLLLRWAMGHLTPREDHAVEVSDVVTGP